MSVGGERTKPELAPVTQGKLVIVNTDAVAERVLYINGTPWRTLVGRSHIWVPVGEVSIGTPGGDAKIYRAWKTNPASGRMELEYKF